MREKLIELLNRWPCFGTAEEHADHLIANGVTVQDNTEISDEFVKMLKTAPVTILQEEPTIETVQSDKDINVPNKWISVKDRLPTEEDAIEGGFVLANTEEKIIIALWSDVCRFNEFVTHWMPLPQPPKGEIIMAHCKANQLDMHGFCNRFDAPCIKKNCRFFGVKTNADRIRAMSDEELATQLVQVFKEGIKVLTDMDMPEELLDKFWKSFLERLKQPADMRGVEE